MTRLFTMQHLIQLLCGTSFFFQDGLLCRTISFAIEVNDASVLGATNAWVGVGIGEETSGGMLGADIYTAEFGSDAADKCTVKDRFVPFVAAPLTADPQPFPQEDKCQEDGSWNLVSCKRDKKKGRVTLEVSRPLNATTFQDRPINAGEQPVLHAYGESFKYHGKHAASKRIVFFDSDGSYPNRLWKADGTYSQTQEIPLPPDVIENFSISATNYSVPTKRTTYACTSAFVPVKSGAKRYVVAVDPVFNSSTGPSKVHHYLLYSCKNNAESRSYLKTKSCSDIAKHCTTQIYAWAVGMGRFILPENVGIPIDETTNLLVLETHYDNPDGTQNIIDNSGAKLYLSKNRVIEAGILALGDAGLSLHGQKVKSGWNYTSTCPSTCTLKWAEPEITVISSTLHMHTTGKHIYTNRFDANGTFIETINSIEFWSNEHQVTNNFVRPRKIKKGDILSTTCIYDTTKRPDTKFGLETLDEMCIDFLLYYPAQRVKKTDGSLFQCSMLHMPSSLKPVTLTLCGERNINSVLFIKNPSLNDTVGISRNFGKKSTDTCKVDSNKSPLPSKNNTATAPKECFPADATVQTRTRGIVTMEDLKVGDEVLAGKSQEFSKVFMFTHRSRNILVPFISIETELGYNTRLTSGHMLYVNGYLTRAENVKLGDTLLDAEGISRRVVRITSTMKRGLYNPQTEHGDIVVNGIVCSTYTDAVVPSVGHALLSPLRMLKYLPTNRLSLD